MAPQLHEAMQQIEMLKEQQSVARENIKGDELKKRESVFPPTANHTPLLHAIRNETLSKIIQKNL